MFLRPVLLYTSKQCKHNLQCLLVERLPKVSSWPNLSRRSLIATTLISTRRPHSIKWLALWNVEHMNFIYLNCATKEITSQQNTQLVQLWKESVKKFRLSGIWTLTSAILNNFKRINQWAALLRTSWVVKTFIFSYAFRVISTHFIREFYNTTKRTCIYT